MNPSESNLAAGAGNEALLRHQQPEASENHARNRIVFDVDIELCSPSATNTAEKTFVIDNVHQNGAGGQYLSRSAKVEMLEADSEISPFFTGTQGAHDDSQPPVSEVRPCFPYNPSPVTKPSFLSTEESADNQLMVSATNAEYAQANWGVYLSVPVSRAMAPAASLTFNTDYSEGYDSGGELGPFYDAVECEEDFESDEDDDSIFFYGSLLTSSIWLHPKRQHHPKRLIRRNH